MTIQIKRSTKYFLPEGMQAKEVSEEEYYNYPKELLQALDQESPVRVPGMEGDKVLLSFLHQFEPENYEGKNFRIVYLGIKTPMRYKIVRCFSFVDYFEAKRRFDLMVMRGRPMIDGSTY